MIESAVTHPPGEVLKKLKLVFGLELRQRVTCRRTGSSWAQGGKREDERCWVEIDRQQFNQLADEKHGRFYRRAENRSASGSREIRCGEAGHPRNRGA